MTNPQDRIVRSRVLGLHKTELSLIPLTDESCEVTAKSSITGIMHTRRIPCSAGEIRYWQSSRRTVQSVLPELSPDDREFLISGITPEEWEQTFGQEED